MFELPGEHEVIGRAVLPIEVVFRPCSGRDLADLEWFGRFSHHREVIRDAWERQLRGENLMLLADVGGFPVGQAWLDLVRRREHGIGYLWAVRVFPLFRGQGLGRHLLDVAEELLGGFGFRVAEVAVETWNERARSLYEDRGYRCVDTVVERWGYTTPEGEPVRHESEQWLLHKPLRREP